MGILSTAEWLASIDRSSVVFSSETCLHSHSTTALCQTCYEICPAAAIQPGKPPHFAAEVCQTCLACLPVCPTGAYRADDSVQDLLLCATRLDSKEIELLCTLHPAPEKGVSSASEAIQARGCLAGLGAGAYLGLAALGVTGMVVRADACSECPWGVLKDKIAAQVEAGAELLTALIPDVSIQFMGNPAPQSYRKRPLWKAENPPLSRRDLFRMAAQRSQVAAARALNANQPEQAGPHLGRDRRRINEAVNRIAPHEIKQPLDLGALAFANLEVSAACTACGVCGRACPTGALSFNEMLGARRFALSFEARKCIGCDLCAQVCAPLAITVDHHPDYSLVFSENPVQTLRQGEVISCERCNILFASEQSGEKLCPLCRVRRESPFGVQLPESMKHIQDLIEKRKHS